MPVSIWYHPFIKLPVSCQFFTADEVDSIKFNSVDLIHQQINVYRKSELYN